MQKSVSNLAVGYSQVGRLQDLMALIQILAFRGDSSHWTESRIKKEIRKEKPLSSESWVAIALEHPEFFRVRPPDAEDQETEIALFMRYGVKHTTNDKSVRVRPPIPLESARALFDLARSLNDNAVNDRRHLVDTKMKWIPPAVTGSASLVGALIGAFVGG
jgi:hypothetical protein